jgi:hypothetical protein
MSNDYKINFKNLKLLTAWARNVGFALHIQKNAVFRLNMFHVS